MSKMYKEYMLLTCLRNSKKFPQNRFSIIGGFYFLRFFCPAIVSPDLIGIVSSSIDTSTRRALILISKILQNIANSQVFHEEYMKPLNSFVTKSSGSVQKLFDTISKDFFDDSIPPSNVPLLSSIEPKIVFKIHYLYSINLTKIGSQMESMMEFKVYMKTYETLLDVMFVLGKPVMIRSQENQKVSTQSEEAEIKSKIYLVLNKFLNVRPKQDDLVKKKILK